MKHAFYKSLFFLFFPILLSAQENLIGIERKNNVYNLNKSYARLNANGMLLLPIIDDFSYSANFPADSIWVDKNVFVNNDFSYLNPSIGVATFDALNEFGYIYSNATSTPFDADYLTSRPIRLDSVFGITPRKIKPIDSIYMSFYFQPQGLGDAPEVDDSLVLEFLMLPADSIFIAADTIVNNGDTTYVAADTIINDRWRTVWSSEGMTLEEFYSKNQTYFKQVFVPIMDTVFLTKGFRFRFRNYASVANNFEPSWASNVDQWNLDYVYIDMDRKPEDMGVEDVALSDKLTSLIKDFNSMPWNHFIVNPTKEMKTSLPIRYSNLGSVPKNVTRRLKITDLYGGSGNYISTGSNNWNSNAFEIIDYSFNPAYTFNSTTTDSAKFLLQAYINTSSDLNRTNDTVKLFQYFNDYYAYDDGNADFGYGLTPANAKLAYKYRIRKKDTLTAIDIFFNSTRNNANQKYFTLMVWKSIFPEVVLYKKSALKPVFEDSLNQFYRYTIADSLLLVSDTIYIGVKQSTIDNLNIGFDINNDASQNMFYNVDGSWFPTMYQGALMIRPVFGKSAYIAPRIMADTRITPYPNPVYNSELFFYVPQDILLNNDLQNVELKLYNSFGQLIISTPYKPSINIASLTDGVYFLSISNLKSKDYYTHKIIISKK